MVGQRPADHGRRAWQQAYRALEHNTCKNNCRNKNLLEKFPKEISDFANHFVQMQDRRHQCDYDPLYEIEETQIEFDIAVTKTILPSFKNAKEIDRRAFCVLILFQNRPDPIRIALEKEKEKRAKDEEIKLQTAKRKTNKKKNQQSKLPPEPDL
jgi:hypothetical protein